MPGRKISLKKKILLAVISAFVCLSLSSCDAVFSNPELLMSPPKALGELSGIEDALSKAIGKEYTFVYPSSGDYRYACITADVTGDGKNEAIVLYKLSDSGEIHANYLDKNSEGEWISLFDIKLVGTGVDRIDFTDLCGDKTKEVLIGCNLYSENENQLYIYSVNNGSFSQISKENYTTYSVCSLTDDEKPQVMLLTIGTNKSQNNAEGNSANLRRYATAKLISLNAGDGGSTTVIGTANMDSNVTSVSSIAQGKTPHGEKALYIDAYKGTEIMITEVIYYDNGLKNLFLDSSVGENFITKRSVLVNSRDIDDDGVIEIPFGTVVPGYEDETSDERLYYTSWCRYENEKFTTVSTGFMNITDRYYLQVPEEWTKSVTVMIDEKNSTETFFAYDTAKKETGTQLLTLKVFSVSNFEADNRGFTQVALSNDRVFAAKVNSGAEGIYATTAEYVSNNLIVF